MPSRNIVKTYLKDGYYHIYNRGVEKREIFLDEQDCTVFLHYLKLYLSPIEELKALSLVGIRIQKFIAQNLFEQIDLLSFALMPNHFHLQIKQYSEDGIVKLMRNISTSYVMYFNKKYKRVGSLFQNKYKAAIIEQDNYLLHLSRYIHLNPSKISSRINFIDYSSYPYYLNHKKASWVKPKQILDYFASGVRRDLKDILSYQSFVEDYRQESSTLLGELILEDDD